MGAPFCSECGGTRWVPYFSETVDGNIEEAFRLCPCNYKPKAVGERVRGEEAEHTEIVAGEPAKRLDRGA
jgi:hypothetical protein